MIKLYQYFFFFLLSFSSVLGYGETFSIEAVNPISTAELNQSTPLQVKIKNNSNVNIPVYVALNLSAGGEYPSHSVEFKIPAQVEAAKSSGVWCWGNNESSQLGLGSNHSFNTPQKVNDQTSMFSRIVAGEQHTCALLKSGVTQCWGNNDHGQLGIGTTTNANLPQSVKNLASVISISAGDEYTCALAP